jgi:hypothetical protein
MNRITKLITLVAVVIGFTFTASAQQYGATTILSIPGYAGNWIPPASATNLLSTQGFIPVTDYNDVAIWVSCTFSNPAACWNVAGRDLDALQLVFASSRDGTFATTATNYTHKMLVACNTNWVYQTPIYCTNFSLPSIGYLKLLYLSNSMSVATITNVTVSYTVKPRLRNYR